MTIKQVKENKKLTLLVNGRIDTSTAPEFSELLNTALKGVEDLVIDLKDVDYISSAGLRVILIAQKMMNSQGTLTIAHVNDDIMETFELTGFTDILNII